MHPNTETELSLRSEIYLPQELRVGNYIVTSHVHIYVENEIEKAVFTNTMLDYLVAFI